MQTSLLTAPGIGGSPATFCWTGIRGPMGSRLIRPAKVPSACNFMVAGDCVGCLPMTATSRLLEEYKGVLAEIRFRDRARSADEIQTNWMKRLTGNETGLVGYFPLDENAATVARDRLDSSRVITLHNTIPESWSTESPFDWK